MSGAQRLSESKKIKKKLEWKPMLTQIAGEVAKSFLIGASMKAGAFLVDRTLSTNLQRPKLTIVPESNQHTI